MKKISVYILTSALVLPSFALAKEVGGFFELGNSFRNDQADNASPYMKYRDEKTTMSSGLGLSIYDDNHYTNTLFKNIGTRTAEYGLQGGQFEKYSYSLGYKGIVNNSTFNARTPFTLGGNNTNTFGQTTDNNLVSSWSLLNYYVESKNTYMKLKYKLTDSYYLELESNRISSKGFQPFGGYTQTDAQVSIDNSTTNVSLTGGYKSASFFASLQATLSKFKEGDVQFKNFDNASVSTYYYVSMAPSNDLKSLELSTALYNLPLHSTLALNASYMTLTNELDPFTASGGSMASPTRVKDNTGTGTDLKIWEGDISYKVGKLILKSEPISNLSTRVYGEYVGKKNQSTEFNSLSISHTPGTPESNELFGYKKEKAGLDLAYKLPWDTRISGGYDWFRINRTGRDEAKETKDNIYTVALKNELLDFISGGVKYVRTDRSSETELNPGTNYGTATETIEQYFRRFDATDKKEDRYSLNIDVNPLQGLDVGGEYSLVKNEYTHSAFGRLSDESSIISGYLDYKFAFGLKTSAFYELEQVKNVKKSRMMRMTGSQASDGDPTTVSGTGANQNFNWQETYQDDVTTYGLDLAMPFMEDKLKVTLGYENQKGDGDLKFALQSGVDTSTYKYGDSILNWGDYDLKKFKATCDYKFSESFSGVVKYAYERMSTDDYQTMNGAGNYDSYYEGNIYGDRNYSAHEVFTSLAYNF